MKQFHEESHGSYSRKTLRKIFGGSYRGISEAVHGRCSKKDSRKTFSKNFLEDYLKECVEQFKQECNKCFIEEFIFTTSSMVILHGQNAFMYLKSG